MKLNEIKPANENKFRFAYSVFKVTEKALSNIAVESPVEVEYMQSLFEMLILDFRFYGGETKMPISEHASEMKKFENKLMKMAKEIGMAKASEIEDQVFNLVKESKRKLEMN